MMRVLGKTMVIAAAVALVATGSAMAAPQKDYSHVNPFAIPFDGRPSPVDRAAYTADFESPPYVLGNIHGQDGWVVLNGSPADPSQGQDVVAFGNPGQSLKTGKDFRYNCGDRIRGSRHPNLDSTLNVISADVYIDSAAAGGADFFLQPQSNTFGYVTSRVRFTYQGQILVPDFAAGVYIDAGIVEYDVWRTIQMVHHFDLVNPTYDVYYGPDKDNLVLIASGAGAVSFTGGTYNDFVWNSDNCQEFSADINASAYLDNFQNKPEPGSLALLGVGALLALRRRR